jgi:hypothetical protein
MTDNKTKFKDRLEGCPEWSREMLNPKLVEKQELTDADIQVIIDAHNERLHLFHRLEKVDPETLEGRAELRAGAARLEELEFKMQEGWKFPQSRDHHTWWYQIPHCRCPRLDNRDNFGTGQRFVARDCPVHRHNVVETT